MVICWHLHKEAVLREEERSSGTGAEANGPKPVVRVAVNHGTLSSFKRDYDLIITEEDLTAVVEMIRLRDKNWSHIKPGTHNIETMYFGVRVIIQVIVSSRQKWVVRKLRPFVECEGRGSKRKTLQGSPVRRQLVAAQA